MAIETKVTTMDVREIMPWDCHPKIFEVLDAMKVGNTLELINDHDPRPLHYQLDVERKGQFEWKAEEKGPRHWVATIRKVN